MMIHGQANAAYSESKKSFINTTPVVAWLPLLSLQLPWIFLLPPSILVFPKHDARRLTEMILPPAEGSEEAWKKRGSAVRHGGPLLALGFTPRN